MPVASSLETLIKVSTTRYQKKPSPSLVVGTSADLHRLQGRIPALLNYPIKGGVTLVHRDDGTYGVRCDRGYITGVFQGKPCEYEVRKSGTRWQLRILQ